MAEEHRPLECVHGGLNYIRLLGLRTVQVITILDFFPRNGPAEFLWTEGKLRVEWILYGKMYIGFFSLA